MVMYLFLIGAIGSLLTSGCVSNKRHNRDVSVLQAQISTLSNEIARIDSTQQGQGRSWFGGQKQAVPAPSAPAAAASPIMYRTPSGFEVPGTDIQRALKAAGFYDGEIDGEIGPKTRESIREFQRANDLTPDGVCGRKTWDRLKTHLEGSAIK